MVIKKVLVRAAATLSGSNVTTSAVNVRGARYAVFEVRATDTGTLSAASVEVSNDGTNWVALGITAPTNGKSNAVADVTITGFALNAGPALANIYALTAGSSAPIGLLDAQARLKVSTGSSVAGFEVWAFVYYDGEEPRIVTTDNVGPQL